MFVLGGGDVVGRPWTSAQWSTSFGFTSRRCWSARAVETDTGRVDELHSGTLEELWELAPAPSTSAFAVPRQDSNLRSTA